jgi:hypothetical protein
LRPIGVWCNSYEYIQQAHFIKAKNTYFNTTTPQLSNKKLKVVTFLQYTKREFFKYFILSLNFAKIALFFAMFFKILFTQ